MPVAGCTAHDIARTSVTIFLCLALKHAKKVMQRSKQQVAKDWGQDTKIYIVLPQWLQVYM
jgi:hypothetical protein